MQIRQKVRGPVSAVGWIDAGGGEIRYALWGPSFMVRRRRQAAIKRIEAYCGDVLGKYKIADEVDRASPEASYPSQETVEENIGSGREHYKMMKYHHIYFECAP